MIYEAELLHFWELPKNRQEELKEYADWAEDPEEHLCQFMYWTHPEVDINDDKYILWSTEDIEYSLNGEYDGVIPVSNNAALLVKIEEEKVKVKSV